MLLIRAATSSYPLMNTRLGAPNGKPGKADRRIESPNPSRYSLAIHLAEHDVDGAEHGGHVRQHVAAA